jgi:molecular chaperone HscC
MIIGIDLGTTYSVAAYMTPDGPSIIPNALGESLTPSVVGIDQTGELLVGSAAKEFQVIHPDRCASVFKRYMGSDWSTKLVGRTFTATELSSLVLRSMKQDCEAFLQQPVERVVITVPAYFNDNQRQATIRAGQLAGFKVERIINEPTAAAIAYGIHETGEQKIVVVFDLGGGTFDVSVVDLFEGAVEVRASSGESFLGGEDFTRTLAARVLEMQGKMFEHAEIESPALTSRLVQQCEVAKRLLSQRPEADVRVPDKHGNLAESNPTVRVTREQFEKWTEHILARVEQPIRRGLGDARLRRADINEVILVGGATRMPSVIRRATEIFGQAPRSRLNPDEVVALGAAVQAGLVARDQQLDDLVVTDVSPFSMGIEISKQFGTDHREGYYLPIISRNTTIPLSRIKSVATVRSNQTEVVVRVFQGEGRRVEDNLLLGEFTVRGIPPGPAGQQIDVRFTYDLNGVLEVEATIVATNKTTQLVLTHHARGLSSESIERAIQKMQSLKTHPRDEARNRFLMKRADRVYQELPLIEQSTLDDLMDGFEAALQSQDPEMINQFREALEIYLSRWEPDNSSDSEGPRNDGQQHDW